LAAVTGMNQAQKATALAERDALRKSRGMIVESTGKRQRPTGPEGKA
jgi:hypothetical protein